MHFACNVQWTAFVVIMSMLSYSWAFDDDDKDDPYRWLKMKIYTACIASISETFTQVSRITFLLNMTDIVNSITVASTLLDDAKFIWEAINTIDDLLSDEEYEDTESGISLTNGSFKGKTKGQRNITRALALTGINTLPGLVSMDALNAAGLFGHTFEDVTFRDYNLNYFKYHNEIPAESSAKWYSDLFPVPIISDMVEKFTPWHIKKPGKQSKSNKKAPKDDAF